MEKFVFGLITALFIGVGIWIGRSKPKKDLTLGLILLPNFFKPIGLVFALVSIVFVAYSDTVYQESWKYIGGNSINLGLFVYCFAKDKLEDELTNSVRLRSFYTTVIATIFVNVLINFLNFVIGGNEPYIEASDKLITILLVVYAFSFASLKRKVFYGK